MSQASEDELIAYLKERGFGTKDIMGALIFHREILLNNDVEGLRIALRQQTEALRANIERFKQLQRGEKLS